MKSDRLLKIPSNTATNLYSSRLEVNLNAMIHNLLFYKSLIKPSTQMMVMVKALSYGNGSFQIANLLEYHGINYLGVANIDEGINLRLSGVRLPIMIMDAYPKRFGELIHYNLEPEIYSLSSLALYHNCLQELKKAEGNVHIKIDSGMHRLGFMPHEIDALCKFLNKHKRIRVKSVFSHLAVSDDMLKQDFNKQQIATFAEICEKIKLHTEKGFVRHLLNSAGIEHFPEAQFDMVRLGIGLYGFGRRYADMLLPVSSLKSRISQIKTIPANEAIGYGRNSFFNYPVKIGVCPLGYADGLDRRLGNGNLMGKVNGKSAPTVGDVCMDMFFINITGVEASEGDDVVIFDNIESVQLLAKKLQTICYEILTGISDRVRKVYTFDD